MSEKFVFHGSPKLFDSEKAIPRRNIRSADNVVLFDEESFHATPHKWIALAYTYQSKPILIPEIEANYSMGVDLYSDTKEIVIVGINSLGESLKQLYGDGGFIYHFDNGDFVYKEGLGSQEVIASEPTRPIHVEKIDNPVEEMEKLGVKFKFIDLMLPENEKYLNNI